jgi:hypothetical protein
MKATGRFSYKEYFHILHVKHTKGRVKPVDGIVPGLVGRVGPARDVRLLPFSSVVGPAAGNADSVFLFLTACKFIFAIFKRHHQTKGLLGF